MAFFSLQCNYLILIDVVILLVGLYYGYLPFPSAILVAIDSEARFK